MAMSHDASSLPPGRQAHGGPQNTVRRIADAVRSHTHTGAGVGCNPDIWALQWSGTQKGRYHIQAEPVAGSRTPGADAVKAQLDRILASGSFSKSERLSGFLNFVVQEALRGEGDSLKESVIARELYAKGRISTPRPIPSSAMMPGACATNYANTTRSSAAIPSLFRSLRAGMLLFSSGTRKPPGRSHRLLFHTFIPSVPTRSGFGRPHPPA
jgi:hypothetical protein